MAGITNYPESLDDNATLDETLTNGPTGDDVLAEHQNNQNAAIKALETKVGIDNSEDTDSHDYKIATLETSVSTLQTDLNTAEADIDTLQTDVTTLEDLNPITSMLREAGNARIWRAHLGTWIDTPASGDHVGVGFEVVESASGNVVSNTSNGMKTWALGTGASANNYSSLRGPWLGQGPGGGTGGYDHSVLIVDLKESVLNGDNSWMVGFTQANYPTVIEDFIGIFSTNQTPTMLVKIDGVEKYNESFSWSSNVLITIESNVVKFYNGSTLVGSYDFSEDGELGPSMVLQLSIINSEAVQSYLTFADIYTASWYSSDF